MKSVFKRIIAGTSSVILLCSGMCFPTSDILFFPSDTLEASAAWGSVSDFEAYANANWIKPIRASYLDISGGSRYFGANRSGTDRKHAAVDYVVATGTPVYAMTGGYVEEFSANFYGGTQAISVKNDDGSVARYCEISTSIRPGSRVEQGQIIGTVIANNIGGGHMLHLELYLGTTTGSLTNTSNTTYKYVTNRKYCRRSDLTDPTFSQYLPIERNKPDPVGETYIVATESTSLNIRSSPSTDGSIVGKAPKGAELTVYSIDGGWAYVNYNGATGYCSAQYLTKPGTPPPSSGDVYTVTTESSNLNIRSTPSTDGSIVGKAPKGAELTVFSIDGGWAYVNYNGTTGYCSAQYLTPKYSPVASGDAYIVTTESSNLNIRSSASTSADIIGKAPKGAELIVMSISGNWAYVNYNGTVGYCSLTYLTKKEQAQLAKPTISFDKSSYNIGDTVNISWAASPGDSNLSHYWLNVICPDGSWLYGDTMNKNTSYSFVASQEGDYNITTYATPKGSLEGEGSLTDNATVHVNNPAWYAKEKPVDVGTGFYAYIINTEPWKMATADKTNVVISSETASANQIWRFDRTDNGSYFITNCSNGYRLDVTGASAESGTNLQIYENHASDAQKWFIYGESGAYYLRSACSECVMNVEGAASADGTNVQMLTKNNSTAQKFQIWKLDTKLSVDVGDSSKLTQFSWNSFPGSDRKYDVKIWGSDVWDGDAYHIEWNLNENSYSINLPVGHYEAYVDVRVGSQCVMTNIVSFDVTESYTEKTSLSVTPGGKESKTRFEWTPVSNAKSYNLFVWNGTADEGSAYYKKENIKGTDIEVVLPAEYYEAYVTADIDGTPSKSNIVKFAVKKDYKPAVKGDANGDGEVSVADAVMLQNWLLTKSKDLKSWKNVDLCEDERIDVFDFCLLRKMVIDSDGNLNS